MFYWTSSHGQRVPIDQALSFMSTFLPILLLVLPNSSGEYGLVGQGVTIRIGRFLVQTQMLARVQGPNLNTSRGSKLQKRQQLTLGQIFLYKPCPWENCFSRTIAGKALNHIAGVFDQESVESIDLIDSLYLDRQPGKENI